MKPQDFSAWLRKRAWAIAMVLTVIGIILPIADHPYRLLWTMPITWLVIFIVVRIAAKFPPDMFFPNEK